MTGGEIAERLDDGRWTRVAVRTVAGLEPVPLRASELSQYGGLASGERLRPTGFFRLERVGDRWTLVDPEGCPFISMGLCSVNLSAFQEGAEARKFGDRSRWAEETARLLRECGFNTLGRWSDAETFRKLEAPFAYTTTLGFMAGYARQRPRANGEGRFPEQTIPVFDEEFPRFSDEYATRLVATKDDPWLLGHFSDNELPFRPDALSCYLSLPPSDPGHRAAARWLAARKKGADEITASDHLDFVAVVAERYFTVVRRAIEKSDPNHLYLGSRLNGRNINDGTLRGSRAVDVVSINMYHRWSVDEEVMDLWASLTGRPILNSEWYAMSLASPDVVTTGAGFRVRSQRDRGLFYQNLALGMLSNRNCVGWHWFKYGGDGEGHSRGFVDATFEPHGEMTELMREVNTRAYELRSVLASGRRERTPTQGQGPDNAGRAGEVVTLKSLLVEMTDPGALARFPASDYRCLQASSYNRASTHRDQADRGTSGWFADGDGVGFIRTETRDGKAEWVIMEHEGPGAIVKIWTPFFYYDFNDRLGPNVRIYLDGAETPVIDESLIGLVRGDGSFAAPLATKTARAGNSYVPIPFAKSCKVTLSGRAFYNIIDYRAYPPGTRVETFTREGHAAAAKELEEAGRTLTMEPEAVGEARGDVRSRSATIERGERLSLELPSGPHAVRQLTVRLPDAAARPAALRSTALSMTYDGEETVWTPVGDFFSCADALHPFRTFQRTVTMEGTMTCRWAMPYRSSGEIVLWNLGEAPLIAELGADLSAWDWDDASMHFWARWRPDELVPGSPFQDWNFVAIEGKGVYVGDSWTVLNPQQGWWGEGDEKIYVDGAWERGFPTHFGTGTEDYYGWAGGVNPTRADEFSTPFLANVRVGGLNEDTRGYNICTRTRALDAIPFRERLVFDMESSFGVDIRHPWDLLGYSAVTYWYAKPGARHNRPALPEKAAKPIVGLEEALRRSAEIRAGR